MKRTGLIIGLFFLVLGMVGCATPFDMAQTSQNAGDAAYKRGDYKGAIDNFKNAINQDPYPYKGAWRYEKLGDAYFKNGNYKDAIDAYKQCLERTYKDELWDKYPSYRGKIVSNIKKSYKALKDLESAVPYMEQLIAKDPNNHQYFRLLGNIYEEIGKYDKAIAPTKRAIELNPQDAIAYNNLGWAYGNMKQYTKMFKAYQKAIELDPKDATYYGNLGWSLLLKGDYKESVIYLKKAVDLTPNKKIYRSVLYIPYYLQGQYGDALDAVNKSINLSKFTGIGAEIRIVNAYPVIKGTSESGPANKAGLLINDRIIKIDGEKTKDFTIEKIVQGLRGEEGTRVVLIIEREDSKKPLEKTVTRERIITAGASTGIGYRSLILRQMGEQEEALKDAKQAYSLNSSDALAQLALGASNLDHGQYVEAVKLFSQVTRIDARILEATAYARKGDFKKAIEIYSAIPEEKLSPENVPLWSDRAALLKALNPFIASKMESADRLKAQGRHKEALKELGDALKLADDKTSKKVCGSICRIMSMDPRLSELPEEARKYALRGDVLTEEGKFEGAVKEYLQAVQSAPYIAKLYFNTAMIYGELKRHPQAIRNMKTYLLLAPEAPNARAAKDQIYKWEFAMEKKK